MAGRVRRGRWAWMLGAGLLALLLCAPLLVRAQQADERLGSVEVSTEAGVPDAGALDTGVLDGQVGTAIQARRGRVVGKSGDQLRLQTASGEILVQPPADFSAPLGTCIQVVGEVPLGPVFQANQASLVPAEERAAACPAGPSAP